MIPNVYRRKAVSQERIVDEIYFELLNGFVEGGWIEKEIEEFYVYAAVTRARGRRLSSINFVIFN